MSARHDRTQEVSIGDIIGLQRWSGQRSSRVPFDHLASVFHAGVCGGVVGGDRQSAGKISSLVWCAEWGRAEANEFDEGACARLQKGVETN